VLESKMKSQEPSSFTIIFATVVWQRKTGNLPVNVMLISMKTIKLYQ
jgi:hypothetical protein